MKPERNLLGLRGRRIFHQRLAAFGRWDYMSRLDFRLLFRILWRLQNTLSCMEAS